MYSTSWYFSRMNMRDTCSFESHNPWEMLTIKKDNIMTTYEWKSWLNVCISESVETTELLRRNDFLGDNIAIIYQPKARYIPIAWDSTSRSGHNTNYFLKSVIWQCLSYSNQIKTSSISYIGAAWIMPVPTLTPFDTLDMNWCNETCIIQDKKTVCMG